MEILIGAIALHLVGKLLKKMKFIKDNYIPEILAGIGIVGYLIYYLIIGNLDWSLIITNGFGAAAASVYIHQVLKQTIELLPLEDDAKDILQDMVDKTKKS